MKLVLSLYLSAIVCFSTVKSYATAKAPAGVIETRVQGAVIFESPSQIQILIQGSEVSSLAQIHEILAQALHFPDYYGKNLDALYDMLTDPQITQKNWQITLYEKHELRRKLGSRQLRQLLTTLQEAQKRD